MADKKIYVTHDYQQNAKVKGLRFDDEDSTSGGEEGRMIYDSSTGQFHVHNGTRWDEVVTSESFGVAADQTFDNKNFDGGIYAGG
jgi:hypothetical protein